MSEQGDKKQNGFWAGVKEFYAAPFRVFAFFMGHYIKNRNRTKALMARADAKMLFQSAIMLTVVAWVVIGLSASPEDRGRLTDAVMGFWQDSKSLAEEKKRLDAEKELGIHPQSTQAQEAEAAQ